MASPSTSQRHDICGIPIDLCVEIDRSKINYGALQKVFVQHCAATDASKMSTLVPRDGEIITLITTETDTFALFPHDTSSNLFFTRPAFAAQHVLGTDSVVHGWLYRNRRARSHVAIFDASRVNGQDVRKLDALQRHILVHQCLHAQPANSRIHYHWSGHEAKCMRPFHKLKMDFDVVCIARLMEDMDAAKPCVQRVLPCLLVAEGDLRAPRIVVPPPR